MVSIESPMERPVVSLTQAHLEDALQMWSEQKDEVEGADTGELERTAHAVRAMFQQCVARDKATPVLTGIAADRMQMLRIQHPEIAESLDDVEPEDFRREPGGASHSLNSSWSD